MSNIKKETYDSLVRDIAVLSSQAWENRIDGPLIKDWLGNFDGEVLPEEDEHLYALHLLKHFNYFGVRELRTLLVSMYRDIYRYDVVQEIRSQHQNTRDAQYIDRYFKSELDSTRFIAVGNPSESSAHILYYFRQVNALSKELFANPHELVNGPLSSETTEIVDPKLKRIIFIDDLVGSGQQATEYVAPIVEDLRKLAMRTGTRLKVSYYTLFAKSEGLRKLRTANFDEVRAVHELDDSQAAFDPSSRIFANANDTFERHLGEKFARHYGSKLLGFHPLGYRDGQLLLGLAHNVPDNTLPIFWFHDAMSPWKAIFPRYQKA